MPCSGPSFHTESIGFGGRPMRQRIGITTAQPCRLKSESCTSKKLRRRPLTYGLGSKFQPFFKSRIILAFLLLNLELQAASGHPSAIQNGRATCGKEYHHPNHSYVIPDIKEAWFARRVATLHAPFFWTRFEVSEKDQSIYVAAISPQIPRFSDGLSWRGILFGPGLNELTNESVLDQWPYPSDWNASARINQAKEVRFALEQSLDLPASVRKHGDEAAAMLDSSFLRALPESLRRGQFLQSPDKLSSCEFVDHNPVMKRFSDVVDGRCMELLSMANDYKNPLMAGATWNSWWLFSRDFGGTKFQHTFNDNGARISPGTHFLLSWLVRADSGSATGSAWASNANNKWATFMSGVSSSKEYMEKVVGVGKYEMTLGPSTWAKYADQTTMDEAWSQGTSCTCSVNYVDHTEQHPERIGFTAAEGLNLWNTLLPAQSLSVASAASAQAAQPLCFAEPSMSLPPGLGNRSEQIIEWIGVWKYAVPVNTKARYRWRFHAFHTGSIGSSTENLFGYPDDYMDIVLRIGSKMEDVFDGNTSSECVPDAILAGANEEMHQEFAGGSRLLQHDSVVDVMAEKARADSATKLRVQYNKNVSKSGDGRIYTDVYFLVEGAGADSEVYLAVYTQHQPMEFLATFMSQIDDNGTSKSGLLFPEFRSLVNEAAEEAVACKTKLDERMTTIDFATASSCHAGLVFAVLFYIFNMR